MGLKSLGTRLAGLAFATAMVSLGAFWVASHSTGSAAAAELHGWKYDHSMLTYSAPASANFEDAFALWSMYGNLRSVPVRGEADITVTNGEPIFRYAHSDPQSLDGVVKGCEIVLDEEFYTLSATGQRAILAHEIGHCLGLFHSLEASLMKNPRIWTALTVDDATAIATLYPYPNRIIVGAVAQ
jgi:predicted Zn-dependent protease